MDLKKTLRVLAAVGLIQPLWAADPGAAPSASTPTAPGAFTSSPFISPGRYVSSVAPEFNKDMAGRLEKALGKVPGIEKVEAHSTDATLHFTVKDGSKIRPGDLQKAVAAVDSNAVLATPVLQHSMSLHPGM
jgi:hypothetical protein